MKGRFVVWCGGLAGATSVLALAIAPLAGQTLTPAKATVAKAAPARAAASPKTPWGEPDLQGIWANATQTPLQRPEEFGDKAELTDAERQAIDKQRESLPGREYRAPKGSEQDVAGAYNAVWSPPMLPTGKRTALITSPADGRIPPLTEEARKRQAAEQAWARDPRKNPNPGTYNMGRMNRADGPEDRAISERCLGSALPDFGAFMRIVQSPGEMTLYYEHGQGGGANRIVRIGDNLQHIPANIRQFLGDAIGHWEGNTLVVDTTNFSPKVDYRGAHENLHLIERYTRVDADTFTYEFTMDDKTVWTQPWTALVEMTKQEDKFNRIFESTCHEGNFGLTGMLANTRAAEHAFAEGSGPDPATMHLELGGAGGDRDPFGGGE
jgi:hypothetical protein